MKTKLQQSLALICPSISISTIWEHDNDIHPDIRKDCDGMEDEDPEDWQAWQSEVRASAIEYGEEHTGSDYLGGTWEKSDDIPEESNPTISGYENQMTAAALTELRDMLETFDLHEEIDAALEFLKSEARKAYDLQRAEIEASRAVTA